MAVMGESLAMGLILTALEARQNPFQMPHVRKIAETVNTWGDEHFHRSVSMRSARMEHMKVEEDDKLVMMHPQPPNSGTIENGDRFAVIRSQAAHEPERRLTPLLPMLPPLSPPQRADSRCRDWGEEWAHLFDEENLKKFKEALPKTDSGISLSRKLSSGYSASNKSSHVSASSNTSASSTSTIGSYNSRLSRLSERSRVVTPSSSIRNLTRRSPLLSMRYVDIQLR